MNISTPVCPSYNSRYCHWSALSLIEKEGKIDRGVVKKKRARKRKEIGGRRCGREKAKRDKWEAEAKREREIDRDEDEKAKKSRRGKRKERV